MDRVKALLRAAAALFLVVGTALVLSCSDDNSVADSGWSPLEAGGDIYGTVTGPYGAISDAVVTWVCDDDTATIGSDSTDNNGDYLITNQTWWSEHDTHNFTGSAVKSGYQTGIRHIYNYDHKREYDIDFYLEP